MGALDGASTVRGSCHGDGVGVALGGAGAVGVAAIIPVPVIEITRGLFDALSVIVSVSERGPGCWGEKVTLITHEVSG